MTSDPLIRYAGERGAKFDRRRLLRPMSSREITDQSFRVFQALGWIFLRTSAMPALFCTAGLAFVTNFVIPRLFTSSRQDMEGQIMELGFALLIGLFIGGPLYLIGASATSVVVTQLVSDYMLGNMPDERAATSGLLALGPKLLGLSLRELLRSFSGILAAIGILVVSAALDRFAKPSEFVTGLIAFSGILGILFGCFVFVYIRSQFGLAPTIYILERVSVKDAFKRSAFLIKGNSSSSFGQLANMIVVSAIMYGGLIGFEGVLGLRDTVHDLAQQTPIGPIILSAFDLFPVYLLLLFALPHWAITQTLQYFDRKVRLEGFDIDILAGDVWRADSGVRFQL